jgi:hypothetical protein
VTGTLPLDRVLEWQGDHITTGCSLGHVSWANKPSGVGGRIGSLAAFAYQQHQMPSKKNGEEFWLPPGGNDLPITWAVNGFGHQLRLILFLASFC